MPSHVFRYNTFVFDKGNTYLIPRLAQINISELRSWILYVFVLFLIFSPEIWNAFYCDGFQESATLIWQI